MMEMREAGPKDAVLYNVERKRPRSPRGTFVWSEFGPASARAVARTLPSDVLEGSATLTPDDPEKHGAPVTVNARDMVTAPKGWTGRWEVHSFLKKR